MSGSLGRWHCGAHPGAVEPPFVKKKKGGRRSGKEEEEEGVGAVAPGRSRGCFARGSCGAEDAAAVSELPRVP
jgi:hypothetical protein